MPEMSKQIEKQDLVTLLTQASSSPANDPRNRVRTAWVIQKLVSLLKAPDLEIVPQAAALLESIISQEKTHTLNAGNAKVTDITEIFDLELIEKPWELREEQHLVPEILIQCLDNLKAAFYEDRSEASCRIAVDYMIVAAKLRINQLYPPQRTKRRKIQPAIASTPPLAPIDTPPPLPLRVFPELELDITVYPYNSSALTETRITGRADWVVGYGKRSNAVDGAVLIAVEAKRPEDFSKAEAQLLTYLAILRHLRICAKKLDPVVQGFYTDGTQYKFVSITNDGEVNTSTTYDIRNVQQMKTVFNFIIAILIAGSKSSPNTSPEKGEVRTAELHDFGEKLWVKVYRGGPCEKLEIFDEEEDDGILQEIME